jgi:group I intron endonuclease
VNGKMYVGSGIVGRMGNRFHKHLYAGTGSQLVWAAVQKYGLSNFAFTVVESVESVADVEDNQALLVREDHYLSMLLPAYNIAPQASNTYGVKHSEATKALMRLNYSSERREMIGALNRGKMLSASHVEGIRAAALAKAPMSGESRAKVSANSAKAQLYSISRVDNAPFTTEGQMVSTLILRTLPVVSAFLGCGEKTVRRAVNATGTGVVKKTWRVSLLGLANNSQS